MNTHGSTPERFCFVVMPFGRNPKEIKWFRGWYELVIDPAIRECNYTPFLSAAQDQPEAINDEIRKHLAFDPMVLVDLGGLHPEDPPNSNVMYELGIRHAFGLPLVLMAWEGQQLPFDISNQRAIMSGRDLLDISPTRTRIVSFIHAAEAGRFYNPMEAVGRSAQLDNMSKALEEDSVLKSLVDEIKDLKQSIPGRARFRPDASGSRVKDHLSQKAKKRIRDALSDRGLPNNIWNAILLSEIPFDLGAQARSWETDSWVSYLWMKGQELSSGKDDSIVATAASVNGSYSGDDEFLARVAKLLPAQPWPQHIHKMVASALQASNAKVTRAINELVRRGQFLPQIAGQIYEPQKNQNAEQDETQQPPLAALSSTPHVT